MTHTYFFKINETPVNNPQNNIQSSMKLGNMDKNQNQRILSKCDPDIYKNISLCFSVVVVVVVVVVVLIFFGHIIAEVKHYFLFKFEK